MEASWAVLGDPKRLWRHLGSSWRRLGIVLEGTLRALGLSWERLGGVLGASWAVLGRLGGVLGPLGGQDPTRARGACFLEASWDRLGLIFGRFLRDFWDEISILFLPYP